MKTLKEYLEVYLQKEKLKVKESSYALYSDYVNNKIIPYFKDTTLEQLNNDLIQDFVIHLATVGNSRTNEGLSHSTTNEILNLLIRSLKKLFNTKELTYFEIDVKIPTPKTKRKIDLFTELDIIKLRDHCKTLKTPRNIGLLITIYSGIRIGEICALKWSDINLEENTITISKTIQRISYTENNAKISKLKETIPKTKNSSRVIPINIELIGILEEFSNNNGYILTNTDLPIEPRSYRSYFKSTLKKLNIKQRNFHCLRHTFATRIISKTNDYKTVSELLGHSSISVTLDIYTHTSIDTKIRCINMY